MPAPTPHIPAAPSPRPTRVWSALAVLLWFGATLFFFGDTGKHSDDFVVALRNPAMGEWDWSHHPWLRWPFFWRPLHLAHVTFVNAISWNHPWIGHVELALIHGAVGWMLAGLLVRLGVRPGIARVASLLFVVCPLTAEAALWTSASCNAIGTLFLLRTLELIRRQGTGPHSWLRNLWIALLAFITACWYEPAAAALIVSPVLFLAVSRNASPLYAQFRGAAFTTLAAGLGCLVYEALLLLSAPAGNRGSAASIAGPSHLVSRSLHITREALDSIFGGRASDLISGSIEQGWNSLHSSWGLVFLTLAVALITATVWQTRHTANQSRQPSQPAHHRRGSLLLIGALIFFGGLIPIIAVDGQVVELRSLYVPLLGITIALAGLANGAADALTARGPTPRRILASITLAAASILALAGTVGMIGFQTQFRLVARNDQHTVEQLARLLPNPPPHTMFMPIKVDTRAALTSRPPYNRAVHDEFDTPWTCFALFQSIYKRPDLTVASGPFYLRRLDAIGFCYLRGDNRIPWASCAPFIVTSDGTAHLLRRITIIPADGYPAEIEFPFVPAEVAADSPTVILRERDGHSYAELVPPAAAGK